MFLILRFSCWLSPEHRCFLGGEGSYQVHASERVTEFMSERGRGRECVCVACVCRENVILFGESERLDPTHVHGPCSGS